MRAQAAGRTDVGKVRETNEDQFLVDPALGLYAVADGMGGHAAGEIASELAVRALAEALRSQGESPQDEKEGRRRLAEAIVQANRVICESIQRHEERRGMGTTMVALLTVLDTAIIGHVGDSRVYLLREGVLRQLTSDHSWVNEQVQLGVLSPQDAPRHPMRNVVTRALGTRGDVRAEVMSERLRSGDSFLLCSDGLNVMLSDDAIREALVTHRDDPDAACGALVRAANERGGEDNTTVVVLAIA